MRSIKVSLALLFFGLCLAIPTHTSAATATILLSTNASTVKVGDKVRLAIYIESSDALYGRASLSFLIPGSNPATPNEYFTVNGFDTNGSDFTVSEAQGTVASYNGPSDCYYATRSMPADTTGKRYFATLVYTANKAGTFMFEPEFGLCTSNIWALNGDGMLINSAAAYITVVDNAPVAPSAPSNPNATTVNSNTTQPPSSPRTNTPSDETVPSTETSQPDLQKTENANHASSNLQSKRASTTSSTSEKLKYDKSSSKYLLLILGTIPILLTAIFILWKTDKLHKIISIEFVKKHIKRIR